MLVFVTGATGWIGSAVVPDLIAAGHQVLALARSEGSARAATAAGAAVLRGEITNPDVLCEGAGRADGVIHLAFRHDIAFAGDFATATATDRAAVDTLGDALAGSGRPLAIASGLAGAAGGRPLTEHDRPDPYDGPGQRIATERAALALADRGVRSMSVRFAPTVHGAGDHGFTAGLVDAARRHGVAAYPDAGTNRWAAVHRTDAARLVRLAIEHAPAGSVLHAVAEEGIAMRAIAEAIGNTLHLPVRSVTGERAEAHFGFLTGFASSDIPATSGTTRELLSWTPTGPGLLDDITAGAYTTTSPAA